MEEEKVEALHSFTDSINQSVKMLDREKARTDDLTLHLAETQQKLDTEKARTDDLTLNLTTEKAKNEDLTLQLTETQQNLTTEKAKNKDLALHLTETQAWTHDLTLTLTETQKKLDTEKAKNEDLTHLTISLTKEKANQDTPSTSVTVISHSGASIKYPELMGQYNLVDYINVRRRPVYRKGPNWIFYGSKSLVES